jgi:hypothetical protein
MVSYKIKQGLTPRVGSAAVPRMGRTMDRALAPRSVGTYYPEGGDGAYRPDRLRFA